MTRVRRLRLAALPLLAACVRREETVSASVDAVYGSTAAGDAAGFVAAVPAFEGEPRCRVMVDGARRVLVLHYGSGRGVERRVSVTLDGAGGLVRYSDVRGDLRPNGGRPMTVVTVGFDNGIATALNQHAPPPATQGVLLSAPGSVMGLASWGTPRTMIETVRARCGRAAGTNERG